jgi:lysophospholipase L1-like esterase
MLVRRCGTIALCALVVAGCGLDTPTSGVRVVPPPTTTLQAVIADGETAPLKGSESQVIDGSKAAALGIDPPLTVAVVGDSLTLSAVEELGPALQALGLEVIAIDGVENRRLVRRTSTVSSGSDVVSAILANQSPDLWVIALGTNDVGARQSLADMRSDMSSVLNLIPSQVPVVWVDLWIRDQHDQIVAGNEMIASMIAARPGSVVVDWYSHGDDDGVIAGDGVHLTQLGQRLFAASIAAFIDGLFRNGIN